MDIGKFIKDIFTGNTADLKKRWQLLGRKSKRIFKYVFRESTSSFDVRNIPVIINNRNRLEYLQMLLKWLDRMGMTHVIILDNDSTYPALLEFYQSCPHKVVFLKKNVGPRALWETKELQKYTQDYYIYTDPDVVPDESVQLQGIELMYKTLHSKFAIDKIGLALRIDNLPDTFSLKKDVIGWESGFWTKPVSPQFFSAPVDTTFALYAPYAMGGGECKAYRTNFPNVASHMPWYENSQQPKPEDEYYRKHAAAQNSHWTELTNK